MPSLFPPLSSWFWFLVTFAARGGVFCACCGLARLCYLACMFGGLSVWCTRTHALSVAVFGRSVGWSWCLPFLPCLTLSRFLVSVGVLATLFFCWFFRFFLLYVLLVVMFGVLSYVMLFDLIFLFCVPRLFVSMFVMLLSCLVLFASSFFLSLPFSFSLSLLLSLST